MIFLLTSPAGAGQHPPVAAQSATGIGVPNPKAHQRPSTDARRFSIARCVVMGGCLPVLWRAVRGGRKAHRFPLGRQTNRVPSATPIGLGEADPNLPKDPAMSNDTAAAPLRLAARIANHFGLIADTLDWNHADWLALAATLEAAGKPADALTLGDIQAAIEGPAQTPMPLTNAPAALHWCAWDRDECTVTLAFEDEQQVIAFIGQHPARDRVQTLPAAAPAASLDLAEIRKLLARFQSHFGARRSGLDEYDAECWDDIQRQIDRLDAAIARDGQEVQP